MKNPRMMARTNNKLSPCMLPGRNRTRMGGERSYHCAKILQSYNGGTSPEVVTGLGVKGKLRVKRHFVRQYE